MQWLGDTSQHLDRGKSDTGTVKEFVTARICMIADLLKGSNIANVELLKCLCNLAH